MDPRTSVIDERLKNVKRIIAVSGGKGGVGKSLTSSLMALSLSGMGYKVGLLDLDFSGPSDHLILGAKYTQPQFQPKEDRGILPPEICGIKFLSLVYYAGENPSPLRGADISNVIKEILCITRWEKLDILIIDMPPGMGEAVLDSIRLFKRIEFLVVTTPSRVSLGTVKKFIKLMEDFKIPIIGVIENMKISDSTKDEFEKDFLGSIKFDMDLEKAIGDPEKLMSTKFSLELREILEKIF